MGHLDKDIARIADALEKIAAVLPSTDIVDEKRESNQWASKTQVLNMVVGSGYANDWDDILRLMNRKKHPLPNKQPEGWWLPTLFGWIVAEKERRLKRRVRRTVRKGTA